MGADLALLHGKVYSPLGNGRILRGEAVVVKDGRILKVCDDSEAMEYIEENTEIVDCEGNTVLPGLCDAHCHPNWAAGIFESCSLFDVVGKPEETAEEVTEKYLKAIEQYVAERRELEVIRGTGWNRAFFSGACRNIRWPTRHDLDKVCSDRPLVMESYCQHALWVNTRAIEMSGLSASIPSPKSGWFTREEDGYPAGVFFEMEAQSLIKDNLPGYDYSVEQYKNTLLRYQEEIASRFGITLINDCLHTENATIAYKELAEEGKLNMRVRGVHHFSDCSDLSMIDEIKEKMGRYDVGDTFRIGTIKIFLEGDFMTLEPYEDAAAREAGQPQGYRGTEFYDDDTARKAVAAAMETGMQIHIHAMGDRAVKQAVESIIYGQNKTGKKNRNVIAHLMLARDEDKTAMGKNGIIANCQPRWMIYDSDTDEYYQKLLGRERTLRCYPNKSFLDAGCVVAYGTDFPVTPPPNPFHGIQCAVTRQVFAADEREYSRYRGVVLGPEDDLRKECVSLEDAVRSSSWSGAYQMFLEEVTGSIEEGKSAELVVLDRDIERCPTDELHAIEVKMTSFKGKIVYRS